MTEPTEQQVEEMQQDLARLKPENMRLLRNLSLQLEEIKNLGIHLKYERASKARLVHELQSAAEELLHAGQ